MYCTIPEPESSTGNLSFDARLSYETLGRNAELLGTLSASFSREARDASEAYRRALSASSPDAWARFVEAADALARHTASVDTIVELDSHERKARAFFEQIVDENADLLATRAPALA
jgi:hypothetical protein